MSPESIPLFHLNFHDPLLTVEVICDTIRKFDREAVVPELLSVKNSLVVQWVGLSVFTAVSLGSIPGLPASQVVWLKKENNNKKKTRKNCSLSFCSFTLGKLMRDLEYKTSEYLERIVAEVCKLPFSCEALITYGSACLF